MPSSSSALKDLSDEELGVLASEIRDEILDACLKYGGHLSSNLGAVELSISLVREFDPFSDDILFDVGHQTYAYRILTGRNLDNLRNIGGASPFSDPEESKADPYFNGHSGTAIPTAYGMAKVKENEGDFSYTVAVVGDSSIVNGMSMEALSLLGTDKVKNLIIVCNDNGMSIGKDVSFLGNRNPGTDESKPTFFETMGLSYVGPCDGHDFSSLSEAFSKAKMLSSEGPVVVHAITRKGYGYDKAMNDEEGIYHGIKGNETDPDENGTDFDEVKADFLDSLLSSDPKAYVLCPAMVLSSGLQTLYEKYPERTADCGIAEENTVTMAAGIALQGGYPIVDIYSTFLQRSYDQLVEDISRQKVPALFYIERAGLVGHDGASHHGLYDVSFLKTIPGARVFQPYDRQSFEKMSYDAANEKKGFVSIRLSNDSFVDSPADFYNGGALTFISKKESETLVLSVGVKGYALSAKLAGEDVSAALLTSLLPSDEELEASIPENVKSVFFYDPYSTMEGSSRIIETYCLRHSINFVSYSFGLDFYTYGKNEDLYKMYRMDVESVCEDILFRLVNGRK